MVFLVGDVQLAAPVFLAPMSGVTDAPAEFVDAVRYSLGKEDKPLVGKSLSIVQTLKLEKP